MIKQIQKLALNCQTLNILVLVKEGGDLSMTFVPTLKKGGDDALAKPFTLTGTPEELEAGLVEALANIAGKRETLAEQVAATNAVLEMAAKASADKGTKALKGQPPKAAPGKVVGTAAGASSSDEDSEDENDDEPGLSSPAAASGAASASSGSPGSPAQAGPAMNLFGPD
jgi:PRTRC genetic system protein E